MTARACVAVLLAAAPLAAQWRMGYYSPNRADGGMPASQIYYAPFTHIIHYNTFPVVNGSGVTLNTTYYGVSRDSAGLIAGAHAAGVRVLLCVGIGGEDNAMAAATGAAHLGAFVNAIMEYVSAWGYDGVDIDWEGSAYGAGNYPDHFSNLVAALRVRLDEYTSDLGGKGLLTAFFGPERVAARNVSQLDRVNVACYDNFSFQLTRAWHNAALFDPSGRGSNRTCQNVVNVFVAAGVPPRSIGAAIPFYGYRWTGGCRKGNDCGDCGGDGVHEPGDVLTTPASFAAVTYAALVGDPTLWQEAYKRRDGEAGQMPYLSIDRPGSCQDQFIAYEDPVSIAAKWQFVLRNGLGGVVVYPMGAEWIPTGETPAERHPLSEALRLAAAGESASPPAPVREEPSKGHVGVSLLLLVLCFGCVVVILRGAPLFRKFVREK